MTFLEFIKKQSKRVQDSFALHEAGLRKALKNERHARKMTGDGLCQMYISWVRLVVSFLYCSIRRKRILQLYSMGKVMLSLGPKLMLKSGSIMPSKVVEMMGPELDVLNKRLKKAP